VRRRELAEAQQGTETIVNQRHETSLEAVRGEFASSVASRDAVKAMVARTAAMLAMTLKPADPPKPKTDPTADEVGSVVIDAIFEVGTDLGETDMAPSSDWRPEK
jgi:hypothetical protein